MFLNGKIEQWNGNFYIGNYCISFASCGKSKILKLPVPSNEQSFVSNLLPKWKKSVYGSNNSITIYYRFILLNRYRSTPTAHSWWWCLRITNTLTYYIVALITLGKRFVDCGCFSAINFQLKTNFLLFFSNATWEKWCKL